MKRLLFQHLYFSDFYLGLICVFSPLFSPGPVWRWWRVSHVTLSLLLHLNQSSVTLESPEETRRVKLSNLLLQFWLSSAICAWTLSQILVVKTKYVYLILHWFFQWYFYCLSSHPLAECSLLNKAPPTPTMYKYRPTYSPGKNHTALTHAYANQVMHTQTHKRVDS